SRGREVRPSGPRPAAMAPEETSTIWVPEACRAASTSTRASTRSTSIVPCGVVSDDDPTLTTIRLAVRIASRSAGTVHLQSAVGAAWAEAHLGVRGRLPVEDVAVLHRPDDDLG